ncbi:MAG TPA: dTDP-4-dehydrorhamnose 3,5-epimerase family protein, partial [Candidatus Gracilibacteria bacterium]|nr:dTDP-4-dehydrorhamnose 3,5-epimerase family protein [Candidatus Gracilibacteria bacterium]
MIEEVVIKSLPRYTDERGFLCELYRQDEDQYQPKMAYFSLTHPGIVRGPHEHKKQSDYFVFIGPGNFELQLWDNRPSSSTYQEHQVLEVGQNQPCSVLIPPG